MSKSTKVLLKFTPILLAFGLVFLIAALPSLAIESELEAEQMVMAFSEVNPNAETSEALLQNLSSPVVTFQIVIKNRSPYGGLDTSFSSGVWALHAENTEALFTENMTASAALEALAEDGDTALIIPELMADTTIWQHGQFGPISAGDLYTFTVATTRTDAYLSWATMFSESNDIFVGPGQNGMPLFDNGVPRYGDVVSDVQLWDAGTERNQAPGMGPHQPTRGMGIGFPEKGVYTATDSTRSLPAAPAIGKIEITESGGDFSITMTNVSTAHPNAMWTPLTSIFYTLHAQNWDGLFTEGQAAPTNGLEALAEYGQTRELFAYYTLTNSMGLTQTNVASVPWANGIAQPSGPLLPEQYYEFQVTPTAAYPCLSMASMVVESNDAFLAFRPKGLCLVDGNGTPRNMSDIERDIKKDWRVWDAGTEANETPGAGSWQPRRTGEVNAGPVDANLNVRLYEDMTNDLAPFNFATIEPGAWMTGMTGMTDTLTLTVTNVSSGTAYQGILGPMAWAVHPTGTQIFTVGEQASAGLEKLAENGDPMDLQIELNSGSLIAETYGSLTHPDGTYNFDVTPNITHPWLSVAAIVIPSNDTFIAFGSQGIRLLEADGSPRDVISITADIAAELRAWDAGTEQNQAGAAGLDQPTGPTGPANPVQRPGQAAPNTGQMEIGHDEMTQYVRLLDDRVWYYPNIDDLIEVSLMPSVDASLQVRKWSDRVMYTEGETIDYHYAVSNTGRITLTLVATDALEINETGSVTMNLSLGMDVLGPGDSTTATLSLTATHLGRYTNTVWVTGYPTFPDGTLGFGDTRVNEHATYTVDVAQVPIPTVTFEIVVKNRSPYGGLDTPFSPGVWALHAGNTEALFTENIRASAGLEALAEDGDTSLIIPELMTDTIWEYGQFGPISADGLYTFTVVTTRTDAHLSWATMFVESNDIFVGPGQNGMPLFEIGVPRRGDVTADVQLWDAGTERNQAPGMGPHQPMRGMGIGFPEKGVYTATDSTRSLPAAPAIGKIEITESGGDFSITMTNVSITHPNAMWTPLTPIFYTLHAQDWEGLFTDGQPAPANGLEALAEDGQTGELVAYYMTNSMGLTQTNVASVPRVNGIAQLSDLLMPEQYYEFQVNPTEDYPCLSMASMVVESNDAFLAFRPKGLCLVDENGTPRNMSDIERDIKKDWHVWDAGTEANETPGAGSWQPRRTDEVNEGPDDANPNVRLYRDATNDLADFSNFATIEPGAWVSDTLTLTVSNVSSGTAYQGLLGPVVWAVHTTDTQIFTVGEQASAGLEKLAEDGDPTDLQAELNSGSLMEGTNAALLHPDRTYSFDVTPNITHPWLSVAAMVIPSNDTFMAFGSQGIRLLEADGSPRDVMSIRADIAAELIAWDAGTEQNQAGAAGPDQPTGPTGPTNPVQRPGQPAPNTGQMEIGHDEATQYVRLLDDRVWYYPGFDNIDDLIEVSLTPSIASLQVRKWSDRVLYTESETIDYHYEVLNTGGVTLTLVATDALEINETGPVTMNLSLGRDELGPGDSTTATLAVTITHPGRYTNTVWVTGYFTLPDGIMGFGDTAVNEHATYTVSVAEKLEPSIAVQKEAGSMMVKALEPITYTIRITNDSQVPLMDVRWEDSLLGQYTPTNLAPNAEWEMTYAHIPTTPMTLTNVITVWGTSMAGTFTQSGMISYSLGGDVVSNTASVTVVVGEPDPGELYVEKTANTDLATVGDTVTYTIKVGVTKGGQGFTDVHVIDEKINLSRVISSINNGEMVSQTLAYDIQESDSPWLTNTVVVTGWQDGVVVTVTDMYTISAMHLALSKTGPVSVKPGDIITYEYTIRNSGNTTVTITDVADSLIPGALNAWLSATLGPAVSATLSASYTTVSETLNLPSVQNTAWVTGTYANNVGGKAVVVGMDVWTVTLGVPAVTPTMLITKTASAAYVDRGQVVTYTYMVHNTGQSDFTLERAESINTQADGTVVFSGPVSDLEGMTVTADEKKMSMVTYTTKYTDYPTLVNMFTVVASNTAGTVTETASVAVDVGDVVWEPEQTPVFTHPVPGGDIIIEATAGMTGRLNLRMSDVFTPTDLRGLTEDQKDSWCFRFDLTRVGENNEILPIYATQSLTLEVDVPVLQERCVQFVQQTTQAYRSTPDGWVKEGITMEFDFPTIRVILTHLSDFIVAAEERVDIYLPLVNK